jgi:UDP-arabinose 4-epimerase
MLPESPQGLKLRSVLVIGGTGPMGASTCRALANSRYVPIAYDRPRQGQESGNKWGPSIRGTLMQKDLLASTIAEYRPDALVVCTDLNDEKPRNADPVQLYRSELAGTLNLLELTINYEIQDLIWVSSADLFGDPGPLPVREDQSAAPISISGSCHMICERMIEDFAAAHSFRYAILRGFALAGLDDDIAADIKDDRSIISDIMAVAAGLKAQLIIRGSNYPTRDGTIIRDYVHSTDFANALLSSLKALESGATSRIYNIGSGIGTSTLELVHMTERISGRRIPIAYAPKREDEPPVLIADSSLARVVLGWTPKQSASDQIIRSVWSQWYKRHIEPFEHHTTRIAG